MTDDDAKGDEELRAELDAIDASLRDDTEAALRASLAGRPPGAQFDTMAALLREHHAAVRARRAVVVDMLANAALPRRLRHLDGLLAPLRDELADVRERFAGTPKPAPVGTWQEQIEAIGPRARLRQRIDVLLVQISYLAAYRAEVVARLRALGSAGHQEESVRKAVFSPLGRL